MESGCSSFSWETQDKKHLLGRTYDQFGNLDGNRIAAVPRNYIMKTELDPESGITVKNKYSFIGMSVIGFDFPLMVDGINEKGLMGALLHYPGYAVYGKKGRGTQAMSVHPGCLAGYILGQCASVDEAAAHLALLELTDERIMDKKMPVHYIFTDRTGETMIVEPDAGELKIHRNTVGVMTNSPDYLWHKTNLRNYTPVTNLPKPGRRLLNIEISGFGEGAGGGFGLPGDYSSPSRFVRLAFLKDFAVKGKDELDGITRMFRNFAPVDIPEGILMELEGKGMQGRAAGYEQTLCISAMCSESLTYYFSTASNRRILAVRLEKELDNTQVKYFELHEKQDIRYLN